MAEKKKQTKAERTKAIAAWRNAGKSWGEAVDLVNAGKKAPA